MRFGVEKESPGEPGLDPRGVERYIEGVGNVQERLYSQSCINGTMVVGKTAAPLLKGVTVGRDLTQAQSESLKRGLHWSAKPVKVADNLS